MRVAFSFVCMILAAINLLVAVIIFAPTGFKPHFVSSVAQPFVDGDTKNLIAAGAVPAESEAAVRLALSNAHTMQVIYFVLALAFASFLASILFVFLAIVPWLCSQTWGSGLKGA